MKKKRTAPEPAEIPVIGDVDDWESDVIAALLEVPRQGECVFYIDSFGGTVYGVLAAVTLLRHRKIRATAMVLGDCSSSVILLFAACAKRYVTPYSRLTFHRLRWQSDKDIGAIGANAWGQHFTELQRSLDDLQVKLFGQAEAQLRAWMSSDVDVYVSGSQMVALGLAEMLELF